VLWGYLPGELALRTSGKTLGTILSERIARPLDADVHLGLATAEHGRVADLVGPNHARVQPDLAALLAIKMPPLYRTRCRIRRYDRGRMRAARRGVSRRSRLQTRRRMRAASRASTVHSRAAANSMACVF
jgi:CubicO group peptidase (beta-lactamase class C family)